jgi:hypothetical protein
MMNIVNFAHGDFVMLGMYAALAFGASRSGARPPSPSCARGWRCRRTVRAAERREQSVAWRDAAKMRSRARERCWSASTRFFRD